LLPYFFICRSPKSEEGKASRIHRSGPTQEG
jgi:hypothetical protein